MKKMWTFVRAEWKGEMRFAARDRYDNLVLMDAGRDPQHRSGMTPIEAFLSSLAGCAGINLLMMISPQQKTVNSLVVKAECFLSPEEPRSFEKIHLIFQVSADIDDQVLAGMIGTTMTSTCPIAVTIGKASSLTWEYEIIRDT